MRDGWADDDRSSKKDDMREAIMDRLNVKHYRLPLGHGGVRVLVSTDAEQPKSVLMSYQGFLQVWGALFVAVEALKAAGFDLEALSEIHLEQIAPAIIDAQGGGS